MMLFSLVASLSLAASVSAHATFQELWVNGVDQGDYCVRLPQSNNPVTSVTTNDIACNVAAQAAAGVCTVPAGASITQPGDRSCANEAIGGDHYGPMNIYLAKVSDATTAVGSSASWFKIAEIGLPSSNPDYWGTEVLNDNCGHYTVTVPASIPSGQYLLRAEVIALHIASSPGGAQFYMSCYQINVTGGTGSSVPAGVSLPGAYSASDPGILINIYTQLNSYTIPGPQPYGTTSLTVATTAWPTAATWATANQPKTVPHTAPGGASGNPTTTATTTAKATTTGATTTTKSTTTTTTKSTSTITTKSTTTTKATTTTTTTTAAGATQTHYGQCGGQSYTGPTVCASPYTCQSSSIYYSQCL